MTKEKVTILNSLGIEINRLDDATQQYIRTFWHLPNEELIQKLYDEKYLPCTATMPVDERTMHHKNRLAGGSSLALAECLAGYASKVLFCNDDEFATGMQVSANHVFPAMEGQVVTAKADIVHKGTKTHVWNVDMYTEKGRLISSTRVTNMVIKAD